MRALAVGLIAGAFGVGVGDAAATSCVYPPLRFEGGSYDFVGAVVDVPALGDQMGTAEYPNEAGGDDDCDVEYGPEPVHAIEGVPPAAAVAEEDGSVWVSGGRCAPPRSVVECLQEPLRFKGRIYHPVAVGRRRETARSVGSGRLGERRVRLGAYEGIRPRAMVGVVGKKRVVYLADGVCRVAREDGLAGCLRNPKVVALGPLPESGRDLSVIFYGVAAAAAVLAVGLVVRRRW